MSKQSQTDETAYVSFGDLSRGRLNQQCQYGSRYVDGRHGYPNLGEGLRFRGTPADYHTLLIHRDDADEFVQRVAEWRQRNS